MKIFFNSIPAHVPFSIDTMGNHWEQEPVFRPAGYPCYHYLRSEEGEGRIEIQGKKHILHEGEGVLIAPFISHFYEGMAEQWRTSFFTITGRMESSIAGILENRNVIFRDKEQGRRIQSMLDEMLERYKNPPFDAKQLSLDCYRLLMEFVDGVYTDTLTVDPLYCQYVAPAIKEIETSYDTKLTVQELSKKLYITPQYLTRLFQRFLDCSTYEYVTNYRLIRAKEFLLTDPGMEVQEIAGRVGFEEPSHFIAMFKKMTGITPLEFRRLYVTSLL